MCRYMVLCLLFNNSTALETFEDMLEGKFFKVQQIRHVLYCSRNHTRTCSRANEQGATNTLMHCMCCIIYIAIET